MWVLPLLFSVGYASELLVDFGPQVADTPVAADSATLSWSRALLGGAPTGDLRVDASVTRPADEHSGAIRKRLVDQVDSPSQTQLHVVFTDDGGVATRLSLVTPRLVTIQLTDPATERATDVIELATGGVQVDP